MLRGAPSWRGFSPRTPPTWAFDRRKAWIKRTICSRPSIVQPAALSEFDSSSRVFRSSFPRADDTAFRTNAWLHGVAASAGELRPLVPTLLHAFAHAAKEDSVGGVSVLPDQVGGAEVRRSYRALYHGARAMAASLRELGVGKGDRVLLVLPTCAEFLEAFFAVQLLGAVPVPSYPPAILERAGEALRRLRLVLTSSGARVCVTNKRIRPLLGELALGADGAQTIAVVEALAGGDARAVERPRVRPDDPAFIQYTSGSTDRPKGVLLTHGNLVANIHAIGQAVRMSRADSVFSWLPLYHDMGLIGGLLTSVYWRLELTLMSPPAFLADPLRWLREMTRVRATLCAAPNFAYSLCVKRAAGAALDGIDLAGWRVALNGAEPVNPQTVRDFHRVFGPRGFRSEAMLPVYGLAEVSLAAAFPSVSEPPRWERVDRAQLAAGHAVVSSGAGSMEVTSVGRAVPGHAIAVVDEHGAPLPDREVGHVVVSGPSVMGGYFGDAAATEAVLEGDTLWTGDLGYRVDGELFVTGRAKDIIIVRGRNYYAEDLERVAAGVDGVRPGGVVAFGVYDEDAATELVVLVCETALAAEPDRLALVRRVAAEVSAAIAIPLDEVVLTRPGSIPKTPSGKAQRSLCRQLHLAGELGRPRNSKLATALVFARSSAGYLASTTRRLLRRRPPD